MIKCPTWTISDEKKNCGSLRLPKGLFMRRAARGSNPQPLVILWTGLHSRETVQPKTNLGGVRSSTVCTTALQT